MIIREYKNEDYEIFQNYMLRLFKYIEKCDIDHRLKIRENFKEVFTTYILREINKNNGIIYFAEEEGTVVGVVAGMMEKFNEIDNVTYTGKIEGKILELYVDENYRGKGIAKKLMLKMERYFEDKNCTLIRLNVFEYNYNSKALLRKTWL